MISSEKLSLKNVKALNARAENVPGKFHFIVSRAVTAFPAFYRLVHNKISRENFNPLPNGILYLKGGDFSDEIKDFRKKIKIYELAGIFEEEFFETKKLIYLPY